MLSLPGGVSKKVLRLAAVIAVGVAASGCSTVPSWVDPTSWLGPDVPAQADASGSSAYPDLSNVPAKPATPSTGPLMKLPSHPSAPRFRAPD